MDTADTPASTQYLESNVIEIRGLSTRFGSHLVHAGLDLDIRRGETFGIIGGSGSGKSTLLREMIMLHRPDAGSIRMMGSDVLRLDALDSALLLHRIGVMFQQGGLFASMTVGANVAMPLREFTRIDDAMIDENVAWKISLAGLEADASLKFPAELSGGMHQRAALARALALDPELLFLDEPTAGLDPVSADAVGALVRDLRALLDLTVVIITHDLDLLWQVADRVAVLGDGKICGVGSMAELSAMAHPRIRAFFDTPRARAAQQDAARRGDIAGMKEAR
jgi:phospholipid/cholesterol/gamma-HCH transport system ATP-binding protein